MALASSTPCCRHTPASIHKNPRLGIPSGGHSGHDTATRGKRLVVLVLVLVGQKKTITIAVRNVSGRRRWSKLAEWLSADASRRYVSA
jgi:hypothetical protein